MRRAACIGVLLVVAALGAAAPAHGAYTFVSKWGATDPGYFGHLNARGIVEGPSGIVYIADGVGQKVTMVDQNGVVIKKFGSFGSGDGQFGPSWSPDGIATDTAGSVYVGDPQNCRVQKFNAAGQFLLKWGTCGTGPGQFDSFSSIRDLAIAPNGHVYVIEGVDNFHPNRVQEFTGTGVFVREWGTAGSGDGQFSNPQGITVDSIGNVYVADRGNNRIEKFDSTGVFLTKWSVPGGPLEVSAGPGDAIYVSGNGVQAYDTSGNQTGTLTSPDGLVAPESIAFGPSRIYVANSAQVQIFDSAGNFLTHWGRYGNTGDGQFRRPGGMEQASSGDIYVVDSENNRIERFDRDGAFLSKFGSTGSGPGQFVEPTDVAAAPSGDLYVADGGNNRVQHFDPGGSYVGEWPVTLPNGSGPAGIAVDSSGNVYVTVPFGQGQVKKYSPTGTLIATWTPGLNTPIGIDVDSAFHIYVAASLSHQVKVLDQTGTIIATYGGLGGGDGQFTRPGDVAVDAAGSIFVADSNNFRVQELSSTGTFVTKWGSFGAGDGQFDGVAAVAVDDRGDVLVADPGNNRIQKFRDTAGFPRPKGATPIYATLVPAYADCGTANRMHAAPMSFGSCAPPAPETPRLTVGTPDANGQPAKSVASLKTVVAPGNASTPADEADVHFFASITDVRKTSDLSDYTGELEARIPLTITDKLNSPYPAGRQAGTTVSFPFSFAIPCAATGDTTVGATCDLHTTAETILPGSVTEGARAIWEAGPVEVRDGGDDSDGDTPADDSPFLRQGIFVP